MKLLQKKKKSMRNKAVIGLGFGDEGKGLVTDFLCLQSPKDLVIRYSGGQQAGHTVVRDDISHVFSSFGSGTMNGNPTYWSKFCTVDPVGLFNELQVLLLMGLKPTLYIDGKCPVTTPIEKHINRLIDTVNGTCGVGVGATYQREENFHSILFEDLFFPKILQIKLDLLQAASEYTAVSMEAFLAAVKYITTSPHIIQSSFTDTGSEGLIFEGSQGLLLDQHYGFFPHVTRSNVGSKNILTIVDDVEFYAVTRAYQTRHGMGPMTNLDVPHKIQRDVNETNVYNKYQGHLRISILDLDLLEYGISKDERLSKNRDNLVITCLDHITEERKFTYNGGIVSCKTEDEFTIKVGAYLGFKKVYLSHTSDARGIKLLY